MAEPEGSLEAAMKAMWTEDGLAARGLPDTSIEFFWGEGEHGALGLHVRSKKAWVFHQFAPEDFPDPKAEDEEAEIYRVVERADAIVTGLIDDAKAI